ncbi:hypothetical protein TcBrA4_0068490 [Trypanosoma cruzi]|nr:hypothetical protein TcBrA4_0068490 [Trypanosoma cruzi]
MPRCIECSAFARELFIPRRKWSRSAWHAVDAATSTMNSLMFKSGLMLFCWEDVPGCMCCLIREGFFHRCFLRHLFAADEAYVVRTTLVYADIRNRKIFFPATPGGNLSGEDSLQLVRNLRSDMLPLMVYVDTWPTLFLYVSMEYFLCLIAAVWIGVQSQRGDVPGQDDAMTTWATSVSFAYTAKAGYLVFLVWRIPIPLVVVVDFLFLLWMVRGFSITASSHPSRFLAIAALIVSVLSRVLFRHLTAWSPQVIF